MTHARARILISTSNSFRDDGLRRTDSLTGLNYGQAVAAAGGLPLMLPNLQPALAEAYLDGADGLLLSGGADIDPEFFGQPPHPRLGLVDRSRDEFELALYRGARRRGLPVLGICRGVQLINVAEGGDLHQHLPALEGSQQHEQRDRSGTPFHRVLLEPGSHLARGFATAEVRVNSHHHQAAARPGDGVRVVARSDDGVVEALEGTGAGFVLGVQWHPEMSVAAFPEQRAPFTLFLEAVRERLGAPA